MAQSTDQGRNAVVWNSRVGLEMRAEAGSYKLRELVQQEGEGHWVEAWADTEDQR